MESVILHKDQRLITLPAEKVEEMDRELVELRKDAEGNKLLIRLTLDYLHAYSSFEKRWEVKKIDLQIRKGEKLDKFELDDIESILSTLRFYQEDNKKVLNDISLEAAGNRKIQVRIQEMRDEFDRQIEAQKRLPRWFRRLCRVA